MRTPEERQETERKLTEGLERTHAERVATNQCRHCGGEVPCWSQFGDRKVGERHTSRSWAKVRKQLRQGT